MTRSAGDMTIPGVSPVVALAYTATIDIPARFRNSRAVGPAADPGPHACSQPVRRK
ncbi:hypothetical protein MPLSOD_410018 [Mesorhizobium sp. SOD10]|nr:hypothetical protein MPLSOD_410018 [Mesorhizobium sp. SOD10]